MLTVAEMPQTATLFRPLPRLAAGTLTAFALMLGGCSSTPDEPEYVERPVEQIYNEAADLLAEESYRAAAITFDEVERQHPYSVWATKAKLMAAFSHYMNSDYDEAIIALDRFIQLHPGNEDVVYSYYLRGVSYYEQISDVGRDQKMTRLALDNLREVVSRFPNSTYARDASLKIDLARDHLAGKEMEIGRFYLRQGQHLAAIGRFRRVVSVYETTTHTPEALLRLTEAYLSLGVEGEAQRVAAVLGHNYPGTNWYEDAYALLVADGAVAEGHAAWYKRFWNRLF